MATETMVPIKPQAPASSSWRSRLGLRYQVLAAVALVALVALVGGGIYLNGVYSPEGAARLYVSALASGDVAGAWSTLTVAAPGQTVSTSLIERDALAAALHSGHPAISAVSVGNAVVDGAEARVPVSYSLAGAARHESLSLVQSGARHLGLFPTWKVQLHPFVLTLTLASSAGALSIDGRPVAIATDKPQAIAVLPLNHRIQTAGTPMVQASSQDLSWLGLDGSGSQAVDLPVKLTPAGEASAKQSLKAAFDACAASTDRAPSGCPQSSGALGDRIGWRLVGDPLADLTFSQGAPPSASGHYLMVQSYTDNVGTKHGVVGGGFQVGLAPSATDVKAQAIKAMTGLPAVARPAGASDQAVRDALGAAFAKCGQATALLVPDCPQLDTTAFPPVNHPQWSLSGDPSSGASIVWDGDSQALTVTGSFVMYLDYGSVGGAFHDQSSSRKYAATLVWDGSAVQVVTIGGVLG